MPIITGTDNDDVLTGTDQDDVIRGRAGDDVINGQLGADQLYGDAGDDTFLFTSRASNPPTLLGRIDGGDGIDTLDLTAVPTLQIINGRLQAGSQFYDVVGVERVLLGSGVNQVSFDGNRSNLEIVGGRGDDYIRGGFGADRLFGGEGTDTVTAGVGDVVYGDAGNDVLTGVGDATLYGGTGIDRLHGTAGTLLYGGDEDDVYYGEIGVQMFGGAGNSVFNLGGPEINTGARSGVIDGGLGTDEVNIQLWRIAGIGSSSSIDLAAGTLTYGTAFYTISGIENISVDCSYNVVSELFGNDGANVLRAYGSPFSDSSSSTGPGSCVMEGRAGNDTLIGGIFATRLSGGDGDDVLSGKLSAIYVGGAGVDTVSFAELTTGVMLSLRAERTYDVSGGFVQESGQLLGVENLIGSSGNDRITGDADDNIIDGGAGIDELVFAGSVQQATIAYESGRVIVTSPDGRDTLSGIESITFDDGTFDLDEAGRFTDLRLSLSGTGGDDTITGASSRDTLSGGAGNDRLEGAGGDDILSGDAGDDVLLGGRGGDVLNGGTGNDRLIGGDGFDRMLGGAGDDVIEGGSGLDFIDGGEGSDTFVTYATGTVGWTVVLNTEPGRTFDGQPQNFIEQYASRGDVRQNLTGIENVVGTDFADLLVGRGGTNTLIGGGGDDGLYGGADDDFLHGGSGQDLLQGDEGDDILTGGEGNDRLDGGAGLDTAVLDYERERAIISFDGTQFIVDGPNGRDVLTGVERLRFADGEVVLNSNGSVGPLRVNGTSDDDVLIGTNQDDVIRGGAGNDMIDGQLGADLLYGDAGDDTFVFTGIRANNPPTPLGLIDGGDGFDTINLAGVTPVSFNFNLGSVDGFLMTVGTQVFDVVNVDRLVMGWNADSLQVISARTNLTIDTGAGDDVVVGIAQAHTVIGGLGNDTLSVSSFYNRQRADSLPGASLFGDAGDDMLTGSASERMHGGDGADTLRLVRSFVGDGAGLIDGGEGLDTLVLRDNYEAFPNIEWSGPITVDLQAGSLTSLFFRGGGAQETLTVSVVGIENVTVAYGTVGGNEANNILRGGSNMDGRGGDDWLIGTAGADTLGGGTGNDLLQAGAGADVIDGGDGVDTVDYNGLTYGVTVSLADGVTRGASQGFLEIKDRLTSIENVVGTSLADMITGDAGGNLLDGAAGADFLEGASGDDVLLGGLGDDKLTGGIGNDTINGDADFDTAVFSGAVNTYAISDGAIVVTGADGVDRLTNVEFLQLGSQTLRMVTGTIGADIFTNTSAAELFIGGQGSDALTLAVARSAATLSYDAAGISVTIGGVTDRLASVETLIFMDGAYDVGPDGRLAVDARRMLTGADGADTLAGGDSNDALNGLGGNDRLTGGAGNDILDGGAGVDLAFYSGTARQYVANSASVSGNGEGTDTLTSIEGARFTDGTLSFDVDGQAAQIMRLYDAALDRQPDQGGFEGLLDELESGRATTLSLANAFIASPEFQARYGALNNQQFVEQLYRFCLDREGDAAGIAGWVANLDAGLGRAEALVFFSESEEHRTLKQGTLNAGLWVADDQATIIARLYDATYDRLPDSGGLAGWTNNLKNGLPLLEIAAAFAGSQEFQDRYGALTNQQFVEQMYRFCLDREGDAAGVAGWVANMDAGLSRAQVLLFFSESAEHVALTRPLWLGGIQTLENIRSPLAETDKAADDAQVLIVSDGDPFGGKDFAKADDQPQINGGIGSDFSAVDKWADDAFILPPIDEGKADELNPLVLPDMEDDHTPRFDLGFQDLIQPEIDASGLFWIRADLGSDTLH